MMRIRAYKRVAIVTGILTLLYLISGCNTTKQFDKAVKNYGVKESVTRLALLHPEQFNPTYIVDTVKVNVEVPIKTDSISSTINCDSIMNALKDGTIVTLTENKNLKLQLENVNNRLKIKSTIKPDTIRVPVDVPVEIRIPCPEVSIFKAETDKLKLDILKEKDKKEKYGIVALFLLGILLLPIIKRLYLKLFKPV